MEDVHPWGAIKSDFSKGLILGNGASIAIDRRFAYTSLKVKAQEQDRITSDVDRVFQHLNTTDFELVLRMLWHSNKINEALGIADTRTTGAYESIRDALIEVIRAIHVSYEDVQDDLKTAAEFMSGFSTVISLNYDVLVYWAILVGNEDAPNRFKDCFVKGEFQQDWQRFREPYGRNQSATLVLYPHGNLALGADLAGSEFKIVSGPGATLLDTVFDQWREERATPLFVSEGTSDQKRGAIHRSPYLTTVFEEVLSNLGETVVIFGWSLSDNDDHLLEGVCQGRPRRFAVAVDPDSSALAEFQGRVRRKLDERLGRNKFELIFFNRDSEACWIKP